MGAFKTKHIICIMLCWLCVGLGAQGWAAQTRPDAGRAGDLSQLWEEKTAELRNILDEAAYLRQAAENLAAPLAQNIKAMQSEITRLLTLYQASRDYPTEQLSLLAEMRGLQTQLKYNMKPLQSINTDIKTRLMDVERLNKDLADFEELSRQEGLTEGKLTQEEVAKQKALIASLKKSISELNAISGQIDKLLAPAISTSKRLDQAVADITGSMLDVWQNYYFTNSNWDSFAYPQTTMQRWMKSLSTRLIMAYPHTLSDWLYAGLHFVITLLVMTIMGIVAFKGSSKLPPRWHHALVDIIKHSWVWVTLGWSLLVACSSQLGGIYFAFLVVGVLLLIWGVASLSWRLRVASQPKLEGHPSPLDRLYPPAALGIIMLYSDLPLNVLIVTWSVAMVVFMIWLRYINRGYKELIRNSMLERAAYAGAFYLGIISLIVCVMGYPRMAVLIYMLLFAGVNMLVLSNALTALASLLSDKLFPKKEKAMQNSMLRSFAIPCSWVVSLLCTLPWLWAVPGATYLFNSAIHADYNIGDASFDFSRGFIILILFFLFRSFVNLSKTSLEHLPQKMPHVEKGVIPPLSSLVTYVLWLIFVIIALGILGVNFTSLAVVAGGLSVGVGLGMQHLFSNLVSGLMLIFGRSILVGDYVDVGGISGTVRSITIRSTVIETPDKSEVFIPNSTIMNGQFINWTRHNDTVRRTITVGVAYDSDVNLVMRLLRQLADEHEHVLEEPAPIVMFSNFGNSTLDFNLMVYIDNLSNSTSTQTDLRLAIIRTFREHNIDIAFPQLDVHLKTNNNHPLTTDN